uniref:Uncharacterized protein n=1 Tax=Aegilops tauschii subsp. strangulata TaxID=200361 RepID=A0A452ZKZ3_AEGTS
MVHRDHLIDGDNSSATYEVWICAHNCLKLQLWWRLHLMVSMPNCSIAYSSPYDFCGRRRACNSAVHGQLTNQPTIALRLPRNRNAGKSVSRNTVVSHILTYIKEKCIPSSHHPRPRESGQRS